jgi:hypothetical protein
MDLNMVKSLVGVVATRQVTAGIHLKEGINNAVVKESKRNHAKPMH